MQKIVGHDWQDIQAMQSKTHKARVVDAPRTGDYGADPIGDGTFRMVPSGDIVAMSHLSRARRAAMSQNANREWWSNP